MRRGLLIVSLLCLAACGGEQREGQEAKAQNPGRPERVASGCY